MIAYLTDPRHNGRAIFQAHFPTAMVNCAGFVFHDPQAPFADGLIVSTEDRLRGLELSGFVMLTEISRELLTTAMARVRKPFAQHQRDEHFRLEHARKQLEPPTLEQGQ